MQTEVVKVTPAIAEQYLSKNIKNRSISQSRVSGYANDMKEGRWLFNPNPVSFDVTGELIDGQHRLLAVIESGCEIDMLILYGAPEASKAIIDFNRPRSASDILKIEGYADANNISALAKKIIAVENGKKAEISTHRDGGGLKSGQYENATKTEVVDYVKENYKALYDLNRTASIIYKKGNIRLLSPAEIGFLIFVLKPMDKAITFIDMVVSGVGLMPDTAEAALRDVVERVRFNRSLPIGPMEFMKYFFLAFEKHKNGEVVKLLRIKKD